MMTPADHKSRLLNYSTKYELIVTNERETYLVAYAIRKGKTDLIKSFRARGAAILAKLALPADASFKFTSATSATLGDWQVKFTGRTQHDALYSQTEYPYIGA